MRRAVAWLGLLATLLAACAAPDSSSTARPSPPAAAAPAPAAASGPAAQPAPPEPLPLRVGYAAPSASFAPVWIAQDAGLYTKHGLRAELINVGPNGVNPVLTGEIEAVQIAGPSVFAANLEGGETLWIMVTLNRPVLHVLARPEIARVEDLRGKAVGVSRLGTFTDQFMRIGLRRLGVDPEREVTVLSTGGPVEAVAAASTGRVAAIVTGPPTNLKAYEAGLRLLLDLTTLDVPYPAAGVATTRRVLREQPEAMRRFARAYVEAVHLFREDSSLAQDVISRYTATTDPADLAESYYAFRDLTEPVPAPRIEAMQNALELLAYDVPRARDADPRLFFDDSLVRDLETSGFFTTLKP